jgi:hypothetical protein
MPQDDLQELGKEERAAEDACEQEEPRSIAGGEGARREEAHRYQRGVGMQLPADEYDERERAAD